MDKILNPATGKPLRKEAADYVEQLRTVRRNARIGIRSGNPATRAAAARVLTDVPTVIRHTYIQEAAR